MILNQHAAGNKLLTSLRLAEAVLKSDWTSS